MQRADFVIGEKKEAEEAVRCLVDSVLLLENKFNFGYNTWLILAIYKIKHTVKLKGEIAEFWYNHRPEFD